MIVIDLDGIILWNLFVERRIVKRIKEEQSYFKKSV